MFDEKKINNKEYFINIGTYFKNDNNPTIFVNDPNNLFLINWYQNKNITFQTKLGNKKNLDAKNNESISQIIDSYFESMGHTKIYKKDKIQFYIMDKT